jgi:polysaccharide biosynthesis protein PslH
VTAPLVEGLASRHEVHVFALTHGEESEREGEARLRKVVASVQTAPGTRRIDLPVLGQSFFSRYPYKVNRFARQQLARMAAKLAHHQPPDAIHCQNFYTALYGRDLPALRKVLYQENFETLMLERWAETIGNPILQRLIEIERRRTLNFEMECPLWFDHLVTISSEDEIKYREASREFPETERHLETRLRTVRPSIDLTFYDLALAAALPCPFPSTSRKNLVFSGTFAYGANADAACWMVKEVMPRLPEDAYSLWLVGNKPTEAVKNLNDPPFVHVTGGVPDIRPFLFHADLAVVPLRIGGGIRLKILEALALGCPVLSTLVGCEGLWSDEDPPLWEVAETPEQFALSIGEVCSQPSEKDSLRAWVSQRFSPERFVKEMEALYQSPD